MSGSPEDFYALVLNWLQRHDPTLRTTAVTKVTGYGSSWEGDTEGGFYDTFAVTIYYVGGYEPRDRKEEITGEDAGSLWSHVVNTAWPGAFVDES